MFKRKLLIGLLAFGTVAGYASGIASLSWHARGCHDHRRARFEAHVADVCTRAAERVYDERSGREWYSLVKREIERIRRGKSVLDPYGAEDPVEFFAVAVEAFFEIPQLLRDRHREVYAMLSAYFQQDPAGWDDARS